MQDGKMELELVRVLYRFRPLREYHVSCRYSDSLVMYIQGGHRFEFENGSMEVRAGQLLYLPRGIAYTNYTLTEDTEYYQIDFNLLRCGKADPLLALPAVLAEEQAMVCLPVMREAHEQYLPGDASGYFFCVSAVLKVIGILTRQKSNLELENKGFSRIRKSVSYLHEFYYLDTPVSELAEMSATCVSNLEKLFKNCLGLTPLAYRNKLRMDRAKMLLSGGASIVQTCQQVGIPDVYYFSRMFKKHWGVAPGEYARSNKTV